MRSPIPWIGGKSQLKSKILEAFPTPGSFDRFVDVFGGGGSVLFAKDKHANIEVYNDANGDLVNLFRCIKYHREELQKEIRWYLNSREMFLECRNRLESGGFTDIQRAAMFYLLVKTSYGADVRSFGCTTSHIFTDTFEDIEQRLNGVVIENKDFADLISVYDRKSALFYCDPPYHRTERHYAVKFSNSDHERLCDLLHNIKGRFVLSYNDDDYVRGLYSDCNITAVSRNNSLSSGQFKEVIITNF